MRAPTGTRRISRTFPPSALSRRLLQGASFFSLNRPFPAGLPTPWFPLVSLCVYAMRGGGAPPSPRCGTQTVRICVEMPCNLPLSPSFVDSVVDNGWIVGKSVFKLAVSADCIKKRQGRCNGVTEIATMISMAYAKELKCGWNSCQAFFRAASSSRDSSRKEGSAALIPGGGNGGRRPGIHMS